MALKGEDEDARRMRFYVDSVVRERTRRSEELTSESVHRKIGRASRGTGMVFVSFVSML